MVGQDLPHLRLCLPGADAHVLLRLSVLFVLQGSTRTGRRSSTARRRVPRLQIFHVHLLQLCAVVVVVVVVVMVVVP